MHGAKGQSKPRPNQKVYGQQNLLLSVACSDDDMPYAYRSSLHPFGSDPKQGSKSATPTNSQDSWQTRARPRVIDEDSLFSVNIPPTQPIRRAPKLNKTAGPSSRRNIIYRCFQVLSILIIGVSLYALVENIKYLLQTYSTDDLSQKDFDQPFLNIHDELQSWVIHEKPGISNALLASQSQRLSSLSSPSLLQEEFLLSTTTTADGLVSEFTQKYVLNIKSLSFDLNNASMCLNSKSNSSSEKILGEGIYFMIIVHSAPEAFEARSAIRSTWGSVKSLKSFSIRLIFVLGKSGSWIEDADLVESSIKRESEIFGDIVSGTFIDSYRNLTYKHLMGYKWITEYCPGASFILKTDDDAFIDMFQLFDFISRTYGFKPSQGTLVCNVFPEGTKPVRAGDTKGTKWAVSPEEYPHIIYPKYCGGLAYLATPDVIKRLLNISQSVKFLWIDDVYITGVLRELIGVEPFYLNLRYSYEPERYRKWLHSNKVNGGNSTSSNVISNRQLKFPFMIAHVERGPKFSEEMNHLWRKTLRVWSDEQK